MPTDLQSTDDCTTATEIDMYTVRLSHAANPDIQGGYWSDKRPANNLRAKVPTFADAAKLCREYIEHNELGGGNWTGGQVFRGTHQVARVAFNGSIHDA